MYAKLYDDYYRKGGSKKANDDAYHHGKRACTRAVCVVSQLGDTETTPKPATFFQIDQYIQDQANEAG